MRFIRSQPSLQNPIEPASTRIDTSRTPAETKQSPTPQWISSKLLRWLGWWALGWFMGRIGTRMTYDDRETLLPDSYCSSVLFPNTGNALHQISMQRSPCPSGFHISICKPHLANCLLFSSHHAERRTSVCLLFNKDRWANRIGRWFDHDDVSNSISISSFRSWIYILSK